MVTPVIRLDFDGQCQNTVAGNVRSAYDAMKVHLVEILLADHRSLLVPAKGPIQATSTTRVPCGTRCDVSEAQSVTPLNTHSIYLE